jgi:hypothetical protein
VYLFLEKDSEVVMARNGTRQALHEDARSNNPHPTDIRDNRDIGINELSPTEWRVSDRMIADGDPAALVGFIQRVDDAFEVTNFGRPRERSYFSSFDRATASLALRPTPGESVLR